MWTSSSTCQWIYISEVHLTPTDLLLSAMVKGTILSCLLNRTRFETLHCIASPLEWQKACHTVEHTRAQWDRWCWAFKESAVNANINLKRDINLPAKRKAQLFVQALFSQAVQPSLTFQHQQINCMRFIMLIKGYGSLINGSLWLMYQVPEIKQNYVMNY